MTDTPKFEEEMFHNFNDVGTGPVVRYESNKITITWDDNFKPIRYYLKIIPDQKRHKVETVRDGNAIELGKHIFNWIIEGKVE